MEEKERSKRGFWKGILLGAVGAFLLATGIYGKIYMEIYGNPFSEETNVLTNPAHVQKLKYLESLIDKYYLEEKDEEELAEGIYTGLLYGLQDPYSRYYTAEEYQEVSESTEGEYVGIGILMGKASQGGALVIECYPDGPCDLAGVLVGDVIVKINEQDVTDMKTSQIVQLVKNVADKQVILTIERENTEEPLVIPVEISDVELPTVTGKMLDSQTGYVAISEFKGVTPKQYENVVQDLKDQGMERMIVDLRDNPGGLLNSVCDVLSQILPKGRIVYTENKYGIQEEKLCDGENPLNMPLIVLVNGNSASASEVFAGAIQDYQVGTIVGTTTYGKGIVQTLKELSDGSAVKMTISKYFTPNGNDIHGVGIQPDVVIQEESSTEEIDEQLEKAKEILGEI